MGQAAKVQALGPRAPLHGKLLEDISYTHVCNDPSLAEWVREAGREVRRCMQGSWARVAVGACTRKAAERWRETSSERCG